MAFITQYARANKVSKIAEMKARKQQKAYQMHNTQYNHSISLTHNSYKDM